MPFYQMLCIAAHFPEYHHIKELVRQTSMMVLENGGVVRSIDSWGTLTLPQRMKRHGGNYHSLGDYWTLHFDASPRNLRLVNDMMRHDPRVIRWTILKIGDKAEDMVRTPEQTTGKSEILSALADMRIGAKPGPGAPRRGWGGQGDNSSIGATADPRRMRN